MKSQIIFKSGKGKYLYSYNNKRFLDFSLSNGSMIFGHSESSLVNKLKYQVENGTSFSNLNVYELKFKKLLNQTFEEYSNFIFSNSGSEANARAIRVSRALTNKKKIAIISGSWHGSIDSVMYDFSSKNKIISLSSGLINDSEILVLPIDDIRKCKAIIKKNLSNLSLVFFEPVQGALPFEKNLNNIKIIFDYCKEKNILTCFDEIITGGRVCDLAIYKKLKIIPDILTLGKIFGGGFPIGITAFSKTIQKKINLIKKPVFFGGTFSGNIFITFAGYNKLKYILKKRKKLSSHFKKLNEYLIKNFEKEVNKNKLNLSIYSYESICRIVFTRKKIFSKLERIKFDQSLKNTIKLREYLISKKIFISRSGTIFFSSLHNLSDVNLLIKNIIEFGKKLKFY